MVLPLVLPQCALYNNCVKKMGVFSKWTVFEAAERVLEQKIESNPYYPFQEVYSGQRPEQKDSINLVFIYSKRLLRFYMFLFLTLASTIFIMLWPSLGGDTEYLIFGVASLVVNGYLSLEYCSVHTVVLDPSMAQYSVYRGHVLIATQHCHNIYLRLMSKRAGADLWVLTGAGRNSRFYLVLNGWGLLATIDLCRETDNRRKLRQLGHKLANNLGINYFDVHDISKHHVIYHSRPTRGETQLTRPEE